MNFKLSLQSINTFLFLNDAIKTNLTFKTNTYQAVTSVQNASLNSLH